MTLRARRGDEEEICRQRATDGKRWRARNGNGVGVDFDEGAAGAVADRRAGIDGHGVVVRKVDEDRTIPRSWGVFRSRPNLPDRSNRPRQCSSIRNLPQRYPRLVPPSFT